MFTICFLSPCACRHLRVACRRLVAPVHRLLLFGFNCFFGMFVFIVSRFFYFLWLLCYFLWFYYCWLPCVIASMHGVFPSLVLAIVFLHCVVYLCVHDVLLCVLRNPCFGEHGNKVCLVSHFLCVRGWWRWGFASQNWDGVGWRWHLCVE